MEAGGRNSAYGKQSIVEYSRFKKRQELFAMFAGVWLYQNLGPRKLGGCCTLPQIDPHSP